MPLPQIKVDPTLANLFQQVEELENFLRVSPSLSDSERERLKKEIGSLDRKARRMEALNVLASFELLTDLAEDLKTTTSQLKQVSANLQTFENAMLVVAAGISLATAICIGNPAGIGSSLDQVGKALAALS